MKQSAIPACYFPTTVVLIDDDIAYLHNLRVGLFEDIATYQLFDNPKRALNYLNDVYQPNPFTQRILVRPEDSERGHPNVDVSIYLIRDEVYNAKRFEQISMVVVDQEMPGLKGLELCRSLVDLGPVKKLMLTGEVDDRQAIEAFNEGLIQQFINKREHDFCQRVSQAILTLQKQYFIDLSAMITDSLVQDPARAGTCCLVDPLFIDFFNHLCVQHEICEYYLTDESGSFMLINHSAKVSLLAVKNEQEMDAVYETAQMSDMPPSPAVLEQIKNREVILYTHTEEDSFVPPSQWQENGLLHPATKLQGTSYYYAHITEVKQYQIHSSDILSFRAFLETVPID